MNSIQEVKYVKNKDIDYNLWDKCISQSQNGNVFAYSWYLDSVCKNWDAIIVGKYVAVIPLPFKNITKIHGFFQPVFFSKTNLFTSNNISSKTLIEIQKKIHSNFKFINIETENFNLFEKVKHSHKESFKLDLISPYTIIKKSFSKEFNKNIEIAKKNKISYNNGILPNGLVLLSSIEDNFNKKTNDKLRLLSAVSLRKNKGKIIGAFNDKNILIAAILLISSHNTVNIVYSVQSKEAKNKKALCGLINNYIENNSETAITLDFFGINSNHINLQNEIGAKKYPYYNFRKRFLF